MDKKIFLLFLIIILLLHFNGNTYCERIEKKDPFLAGVLSWYMPGLGQFYAGEYWKGSIFWVVENTLFISAVLTVADLTFSINEEIGFQFSIKPKKEISLKQKYWGIEQKYWGISLFIGYGLFHVYNVVDAIRTVKKYNSIDESYSRIGWGYMNIADNSYYMLNCKF